MLLLDWSVGLSHVAFVALVAAFIVEGAEVELGVVANCYTLYHYYVYILFLSDIFRNFACENP